jgi:lambda family phage portal protein
LNIFDKFYMAVSPQRALKREVARTRLSVLQSFKNSGYDQSGASRKKKSMKGWRANSKSPQEDIDYNLDILRQRSRDLFMSAPLATSAIKTNRTNVVGAGLKLKSRIDFSTLGITQEQAQEWEIQTEKEFALWAESKWCDSQRLNDFYELQQIALMSWLLNGDCFGIVRQDDTTKWMPYGLRIHLVEADRVCNQTMFTQVTSFLPAKPNVIGTNKQNDNPIYNGVEVDKKSGAVVAYWICNFYPQSLINLGAKKEWVRIEAHGKKTGNPNILHLMEQERCEQYRGVPYLAPVIEALKQISRYTEAELTSAVIQSFFTAFIYVDDKSNKGDIPFDDVMPQEEQVEDKVTDPNSYELGAGTINVLGPGEKVEMADPKRPASGFEGFVTSLAKLIGAALELPVELLLKSFMASYSASRAALLEAWKAFRMRRKWFANDFTQPVYQIWLAEAVARGRIKAPGFFNDPLIRKAWCSAEWVGPAQGQIDPVKEVDAAILRIDRGISTHERETYELTGGNWDDNIAQLKKENELLAAARKPLQPKTEGVAPFGEQKQNNSG